MGAKVDLAQDKVNQALADLAEAYKEEALEAKLNTAVADGVISASVVDRIVNRRIANEAK